MIKYDNILKIYGKNGKIMKKLASFWRIFAFMNISGIDTRSPISYRFH